MMKLFLYIHTLKYLKLSQIFYRLLKRIVDPKHRNLVGELSQPNGNWLTQTLHQQKLFEHGQVVFLNHPGAVNNSDDWNSPEQEKLWLYNLHYFDDLVSHGSTTRTELQHSYIKKWINDNPAPVGIGWEPYPTSLRICNWVKAFSSGLDVDASILNSLAQQSDYLSQDLERHLLGNHLFVNAKALIFTGLYLDGPDANKWLKIGLKIYRKELTEQVLPDGGNFELTPMYHVIMIIDLLDLINVFNRYSSQVDRNLIDKTKAVVIKMLGWLKVMSHDDGEISFFNDSCFGIAPKLSCVFEYAQKLGISAPISELSQLQLYNLKNSGYVSVKSVDFSLIADLSPIGPSYIPGHAHADALSFEFSLAGQRIFVNSGISEYGLSNERLRQRKTAAHNTVSVNNMDSSQVWSGFRVAKRADIGNRVVGSVVNNSVTFSAMHNGFKKQGVNCIHQRAWHVDINSIKLVDTLKGHVNRAIGYLHLHPDIIVTTVTNQRVELATSEYNIKLNVVGSKVSVSETSWHPEFGVSINSKKLCFEPDAAPR